jgi:hypothetical protein
MVIAHKPVSSGTRRRNTMDNPNAFIGQTSEPTPEELAAVLGATYPLWNQLVDSLLKEPGVTDMEWNSLKPKYGWNLILKSRKRRIVYLGPCAGLFRASFILGDKAVAAAKDSGLSKSMLKLLDEAPHYPEGTGVRLQVKNAKDVPAIRKLARIKLAN